VPGFSVKDALFLALTGATLFHLASWWRGAVAARSAAHVPPEVLDRRPPSAFQLAIGFVTNFFDTLGIGSFAPTTTVFTFAGMVPARLIPGTLNVGDTLPTIAEAFILIAIVAVDPTTMVSLIAAAVAGAWLGAGMVSGWSKRRVQIGMGLALLAAGALMTLSILHVGLAGGTALSLHGVPLAIGIAGNFLLGVLMTMGIGLYAPCMILISLLGMNPLAAFPIMMGSCAFLMPVSGARFVRRHCYARRPALGLALGGVPGVLIAAYVVKSLPLLYIRWLVIVVVVYAAIAMLSAAAHDKRAAAAVEG
jgi:uncharacterized membrane protein YfcA